MSTTTNLGKLYTMSRENVAALLGRIYATFSGDTLAILTPELAKRMETLLSEARR